MRCKNFFCVLCCLILCVTCAACSELHSDMLDFGGSLSDLTDFIGGEITDENEVEIAEPDSEEHDFALVSQADGTFVYRCSECGEEKTVSLACIEGTENAYTVDGNTILFGLIAEPSVYAISGSFCGNIVIDVSDDQAFELQLNGLEMYSHTECPISILSGDKVTLSAKKSTQNTIYDMREAVDEIDENAVSASVYALCDLDIQGKGELDIRSVNNNGIHTKDDLTVKNVSLQVDCKDNALKGNDSVTIESGNVVLIARQGDGIKTTNSDVSQKGKQRGTVAIEGGDVLVYAAGDGIDSAYDVRVDESTATVSLQIFTDTYSKYSEEITAVTDSVYYVRSGSDAYKYSLKFYNDQTDAVWYNSASGTTVGKYRYYPMTKPSGYAYVQLYVYDDTQQQGQDGDRVACSEGMTVNNNYDTIAVQVRNGNFTYGWTNYTTAQGNFGPGGMGGGWGGGNADKGDYSTKGIKADNAVIVSAGSITISSYDDAIHANNDGTLENGQTPLGDVTVAGGSLTLRSNDDAIHADGKAVLGGGTVNVTGSYEGIEGSVVEITGGNISVVSSDDGINGTGTTGSSIVVTGGRLYVYAGGDGLDSNSTTSYAGIRFAGGTCVVIATGASDSSIDTERGYSYSGGHVIGIGRSGGMGTEATACSDFSSVGTSKTIDLQKDAYLTVGDLVEIRLPVSMSALVVCLGKTNAAISASASADYEADANGVYWNVD